MISDKLVVVLSGSENWRGVEKMCREVKWLELRCDVFLQSFPENKLYPWAEKIRKSFPGKIIGTVRWPKERGPLSLRAQAASASADPPVAESNPVFGKSFLNDERRRAIFTRLLPFIDYVDVELKSPLAAAVSRLAHQKKKKLILSCHDFNKTPGAAELKKLYRSSLKFNPAVFKIAAKVRNPGDFLSLLNLPAKNNRTAIAVIPMSVPGLLRLLPLYFGSPFTYVFLETPTAPGQVSYFDLQKNLTGLKDMLRFG